MKINTLILILMMYCFEAMATEPVTTVRLCIPKGRSELTEILAVIARDHGFFAEQGLKVDIKQTKRVHTESWKHVSGKIRLPQQLDFEIAEHVGTMKSGCIFGASMVERFLGGHANLEQVKPLLLSSFGEKYDTHIMVAKDSKIKTVKDLRGKNLRIGQLPTYLATLAMLEANGMQLKDVTMSAGFGGNEKLAALNDGRVAATTAYLPAMAYLMATDRVRVLEPNIVSRYLGKRIPHSLLIVNANYARENPKVEKAFRTALTSAYGYLMRNKEEIFWAFSRSTGKDNPWKSYEKSANVAKAASFVGAFPFVDLTINSQARDEAYCDVKNYGDIIVRRGLFDKTVDLTGWLGVKRETAAKCAPQNLASAQ